MEVGHQGLEAIVGSRHRAPVSVRLADVAGQERRSHPLAGEAVARQPLKRHLRSEDGEQRAVRVVCIRQAGAEA